MWRYLNILAVAFWLGGLSFYALVAVPVGTDILGSTGQGFITQRVTNHLNLIAAGILVLLVANGHSAARPAAHRKLAGPGGNAVALFVMHPWLDAMLDATTQGISDGALFYKRHGIYLDVTALQWGGLLVHLWCIQAAPKAQVPTGL